MQFECIGQRHIICPSKSHLSLKIIDNVQVLNEFKYKKFNIYLRTIYYQFLIICKVNV